MNEITIKIPGKLMVAGEFAVLEPNQKLIVMAVNRFVYTTIATSDKNIVHLPNFELHHLTWQINDNHVFFDEKDERLAFIQAAIDTSWTYLQEMNVPISPFALTIHSELDDEITGVKYGLGSSAAVVTSVVQAILSHHMHVEPTKELIFKLASIAHVRIQGNGSGADIAASTFGGVLEYASFQAEWLLQEIEASTDIVPLIEKNWTYLSIKQTAFPSTLDVSVGWTGKPASTKSLVNDILALKQTDLNIYELFLQRSYNAVTKIIHGMQTNDIAIFLAGISENRKALAKVGEAADVPIETEKLATLCDIAEQFGGAGKLSGAGGGDCGLAFVEEEVDVPAMHKAWISADIEPLDIHVYQGN